jgi:hypothetical protein
MMRGNLSFPDSTITSLLLPEKSFCLMILVKVCDKASSKSASLVGNFLVRSIGTMRQGVFWSVIDPDLVVKTSSAMKISS